MLKNTYALPGVILVGLSVLVVGCSHSTLTNLYTQDSTQDVSSAAVSWQFNGQEWEAEGDPEDCPEPLELQTPVDLDQVSSLLYPGQRRNNDYKSHGGFRFDGQSNPIEVRIPLDAELVEGSRYVEQGETQYFFIFIHPCGIAYRFDHLHTLSPKFQSIAEVLPPAQTDDSRTTRLEQPVSVSAGELLATAVGFTQTQNLSLDFGIYDLRTSNGIAAQGNPQFDAYGLCFLNLLPSTDESYLRALPLIGEEGSDSDYCQ